ncbi:MAG: hypothetical protein MJ168_11255 [Clostridia bacterium]|nr:hypothetical protein [Clostridia bacterium]
MAKCFPMRFAHRGLVQYAPENTLGAFQAAVAVGCEGIELDIRMSKDGEIIVVHDGTLERLSNGVLKGPIYEHTTEELLSTDIPYAGHLLPHNPPVPYSESVGSVAVYTDEEVKKQGEIDKRVAHLMTFEQFDKWFETVDKDVTVEIEFCANGMMSRMYEILSKSKNCSRYILFSGHRDINDEIQSMMREKGKPEGLRLGANLVKINEETMDFVKDADLYEVGLNDFKFTNEDVRMLTERGIKVFSNLGDYPEWWEAMSGLDVVAFKTNYAEAYTEWLESRE